MHFHRTVVQQEEMSASPIEMAEIFWKPQEPGQEGGWVRQEESECPACVLWSGTVMSQKTGSRAERLVLYQPGAHHDLPGQGKLACVCCARKQVPPDLTEDGLPAPVLWTPQSRRLRGPQEASSAHRAPSYTESRDERARPTAADGMLSPEL